MTKLAEEIATQIRNLVHGSAINRDGLIDELRREFHGPPIEFLEEVFDLLVTGPALEIAGPSGPSVKIPVVLQVEQLDQGSENPAINASGKCLAAHILAKRNSPDCPRFVALVPPGGRSAMSMKTATDDFGLAAKNNAGNTTIDEWWKDDFIQSLVRTGLSRGRLRSEAELDQAFMMVRRAVTAADDVDRHDVARRKAWNVLARIFEIPPSTESFGKFVSLACGFPPVSDGTLRYEEQDRVLRDIAEAVVATGFRPGVDRLKEEAEEADAAALNGFLAHLQNVCDIPTAFESATSFYYAPLQGREIPQAPPEWWAWLTLERWIELLKEERQPEESLGIECTNSIIPIRKGVPALVLGKAELNVTLPESSPGPLEVRVTRETGAAARRQFWALNVPAASDVIDALPPPHRAPVRYTTDAQNLRKAAVKVVSLETWEPGIFAFCQTANKIGIPKKAKQTREHVTFEASFTLTGLGRHYIDLYVRPGTTISAVTITTDTADVGEGPAIASVSQASDHAFGFEVDAAGECHCDIKMDRGSGEEILRLNLVCDEATIVGCGSEFERLIGLNRVRLAGRVTNEVEINRQVRCVDLQTWMLDPQHVAQSFLPIVIGPDYATSWRTPGWGTSSESILSKGKFLHDPRPAPDRLQAPIAFLEARSAIAARIRGADGSGLVEMAKLGEWLCVEGDSLVDQIDRYLTSYFAWLEAEPDVAAWVDVALITSLERDGMTIVQEPDAILLSPLHPARLAWQALAQKSLYQAYRAGFPCPAASILDAGRIPDILVLPLRTAAGAIKNQPFLSVECSSDYWSVLWNGSRLPFQSDRIQRPPFDKELGLSVGGTSSGFSASQVRRALDDVTGMLGAKPVINVAVSSAAGQNNACDEGLLSWCREHFSNDGDDDQLQPSLGPRLLQVFDDRPISARPDETLLANLAEDTSNAVRWFRGLKGGSKPDLGIIAQLESASPSTEVVDLSSPVSQGALIRHRVRRQLPGGNHAFLTESRMGVGGPPSGDSLADRLMNCVIRLENLGADRIGYTFAPSVHAIQAMLKDKGADFVAVSSSAVDPACFLGGWLDDAYLWDYHLPSYSQRAGDTNGYYLLSQVKDIDRDTMKKVLSRLPNGAVLGDDIASKLMLEVARRGIPTVRGLSGGDAGATGDLGLFISARLLQDEFRRTDSDPGLLPVMSGGDDAQVLTMVIPVDPFRGYLEDLQRALGRPPSLRPDFLVVGIQVTNTKVTCRLTPIEVKYRNGATMPSTQRVEALAQAKALSSLLREIGAHAERTDLLLWRLAHQHLVLSMLGYGFRVYSQQKLANERSRLWSSQHQRVVGAILAAEADIEIDDVGRLIVIDASTTSGPRDIDGDGFRETMVVSPHDASQILYGDPRQFYEAIRAAIGDWKLTPAVGASAPVLPSQVQTDSSQETCIPGPAVPVAAAPVPTTQTESEPSRESTNSETVMPVMSKGIDLLVGDTVDAFQQQSKYLNLSDTRLNQLNIGVVGDLGTGKTQFLKSLVYQVSKGTVENGGVRPRFLIFDYKKDYSSDDFVRATGARVQSPVNLPLNLFDISGVPGERNAWLRRYQFFSDVLDKIYSGIGPVQRQQLKKAVKAAYDDAQASGRQPTIYDVHEQYKILLDGKVDSIFGIIDDLVDMELFAREPVNGSGFPTFLDGVVVIQLNELGQDDRTKNMLVAIMLNMFYEHMLTIPKRPYRGADPQLRVVDSFLLVDEADNILKYEFEVLKKILLQGREFGVGVILASQYLRHFKVGGTDYREPLLSWFIHKVPNVLPQELTALGLTADVAQLSDRIKVLPNHHCLFKTVDVPGEVINGMPFYKLLS